MTSGSKLAFPPQRTPPSNDRLAELFSSPTARVLAKGILEKHLLFHLPEDAAPICFLELPVSDHQRVRTSGFWILEQTPGGDALASDLARFRGANLLTPDEERRLWALASMCLAETLAGQRDVLGIFREKSTFGRYVLPTLLANVEVKEINLAAREDIIELLSQSRRHVEMIAAIGGGKNLMARSFESRLDAFWRCTHQLIGLGDVLQEFERCCEHETLKDMLFKIDQIDRQIFGAPTQAPVKSSAPSRIEAPAGAFVAA